MNKKALAHLAKDPLLKKAIAEVDMPESSNGNDVYGSLLRSIVSQQLSVKAAATIYGRFLNLFEDQNPLPKIVLSKTVEELRAVGLSKQKSGYMQHIANFAVENNMQAINWEDHNDAEIIKMLTQIKGVGVWTVQMILMFTLNREDVFPSLDLGIQQAIKKLYGIDGKGKELIKKMDKIAAPWSPYRTIACQYLWRWKDKE